MLDRLWVQRAATAATAACVAAGLSLVAFLLWWPYDGKLETLVGQFAAGCLVAALVLMVAVRPIKTRSGWFVWTGCSLLLAVGFYAGGVLEYRGGCGDCPPWTNSSSVNSSVAVPAQDEPASDNPFPLAPTPSASTAASATQLVDPVVLDGMILHLPDVAVGARIGDDSSCGHGLSTDGDSNTFLDLLAEARVLIVGCFNQLEAPAVFVESVVVAFPNEDLATRAMQPDAFDGIVAYYALDCCNAPPIGSFGETLAPVGGARIAVSYNDTVAVLGWRHGSLVGAVSVMRFDGAPGAVAEAYRLADIQHQRMLAPVIVPADADDDRLVGLQGVSFPTWWLGETFAAPGLPSAPLYSTRSNQTLVELDYAGIRIEIFDLNGLVADSQPEQLLSVAQELFDSPCTVSIPVGVVEGEAALVGRFVPNSFLGPPTPGNLGWGSLNDDDCPLGEPNIWMASIRFDDGLLVRVNAPICYGCLVPPDPGRPYREPDALRQVLASLRPFSE